MKEVCNSREIILSTNDKNINRAQILSLRTSTRCGVTNASTSMRGSVPKCAVSGLLRPGSGIHNCHSPS